MTKLKDLKKRLMEDPEFREEYARADDEFTLIEALVRARMAAKLTQTELARRLGTTQSAIARLEGGGVSPSLCHLAPLRRSDRLAAGGGPGAGRRLRRPERCPPGLSCVLPEPGEAEPTPEIRFSATPVTEFTICLTSPSQKFSAKPKRTR